MKDILVKLSEGPVMVSKRTLDNPLYQRLESDGIITRTRKPVFSFFGPHIKRTYWTVVGPTLTP